MVKQHLGLFGCWQTLNYLMQLRYFLLSLSNSSCFNFLLPLSLLFPFALPLSFSPSLYLTFLPSLCLPLSLSFPPLPLYPSLPPPPPPSLLHPSLLPPPCSSSLLLLLSSLSLSYLLRRRDGRMGHDNRSERVALWIFVKLFSIFLLNLLIELLFLDLPSDFISFLGFHGFF